MASDQTVLRVVNQAVSRTHSSDREANRTDPGVIVYPPPDKPPPNRPTDIVAQAGNPLRRANSPSHRSQESHVSDQVVLSGSSAVVDNNNNVQQPSNDRWSHSGFSSSSKSPDFRSLQKRKGRWSCYNAGFRVNDTCAVHPSIPGPSRRFVNGSTTDRPLLQGARHSMDDGSLPGTSWRSKIGSLLHAGLA
jgi:hypothetical protein